MLFELRISIRTDFYVRYGNRQAQQNSTQTLEWAQRNGLAYCSGNLEIFGLAYYRINLEIWTSGFIQREIKDVWISATQYIKSTSQSEVCLIQLKLKDKHAASYVEQIGSGSSGEVSDSFFQAVQHIWKIHQDDCGNQCDVIATSKCWRSNFCLWISNL